MVLCFLKYCCLRMQAIQGIFLLNENWTSDSQTHSQFWSLLAKWCNRHSLKEWPFSLLEGCPCLLFMGLLWEMIKTPWFWEDCLMCELFWLAIHRMITMCPKWLLLGLNIFKAGVCSCVQECKQGETEEKYCKPAWCPAVSSERAEVQHRKKYWFSQSTGCQGL